MKTTTKPRKTNRLLPINAAAGEETALVYFLRDDRKIAFAWWFFCLWRGDHRTAFSRQLVQLAARVGRAVTHVDGIRVALRFWELSMSSDPAFAEQWHRDRLHVTEPSEWGELGRLIYQLAEQEWRDERTFTPDDIARGKLWGERFQLKTGQTIEEFFTEKGLTLDQAGTAIMGAFIKREAAATSSAFVIWAAAPQDSKIMVLADRACVS